MMRKWLLLVFSVIVLCGVMNSAAAAATDFQPGEVGSFSDYKVDYQLLTGQSFEGIQMAAKLVDRNKIQINAGFIDGGGIAMHNLAVIGVEKVDSETVIDMLLTLDGQPNKALFGARLTADVTTAAPGQYRVRLWLLEKYHGTAKRLLGESVITVPAWNLATAPALVDTFIDVPWGANAEQIDVIMQEKGFRLDEFSSSKDTRVYSGAYSGYNALLQFHLLKNRFFMGKAQLEADFQGRGRFHNLDTMFTEKYGRPELGGTKSEPMHTWSGVKASTCDAIEISISEHFMQRKPLIIYRNKSLEASLQN